MFQTVENGAATDPDVCVIGAGPAGLTVALELARAGRRVVVLEAGSEGMNSWKHPIPIDELDAERPYRDVPIDGTRTHGFGGTAAQWSAAVGGGDMGVRLIPFDPLELGSRPWVAGTGWPIAAAEFATYVEAAHERLGMAPPDYRPERWATDRFQPVDLAVSGFTTGMYHFVDIRPLLEAWRRELTAAANVTVSVDTVAVKLIPDADGRTVRAVAVVLPDGSRAEVSARRFVIAGGGIENARLLLDSEVDGVALAMEGSEVGRGFMDHPLVRTGIWELPAGRRATEFGLYDIRETGGASVMGHIKPTPELATEHQLLSTAFLLYPRPAGYRPDAMRHYRQLVEANQWKEVLRSTTHGRFVPRASDITSLIKMRKVGRADLGHGGWTSWAKSDETFRSFEVLQQTEQPPDPDNRVELTARVDPLGRRAARLVWSWTWPELESVGKVQELLADGIESAGLGRLALERHDGEPALLGGTHHHMGATRMSRDPATGVVDEQCRVHGVANLYVAGCSVFPIAGYQNPTIAMMALGIRLAGHLAEVPV